MAEKGVSEMEMIAAKRHLTGAFPLRFSSSGRIARILVSMQLANLGIDYLEKRNSYIEAVTEEDIRRVSKKLLDTNRLMTVVVGRTVDIQIPN